MKLKIVNQANIIINNTQDKNNECNNRLKKNRSVLQRNKM